MGDASALPLFMQSITLIGMPGSGKSTIGKLLAGKLGFQFLDLDVFIEEQEGKNTGEIARERGDTALLQIEERCALAVPLNRVVFSPGGSIVYSARAMERIRQATTIIFVDVPLAELHRRIDPDLVQNDRGIIGLREKGLDGLYAERAPLYQKFAHYTVACAGLAEEDIIQRISDVILR